MSKITTKLKAALLLVLFLILSSVNAQNILISQSGTVNVSGGELFYDAGGVAGNDGNTNYTITLIPANSGESVGLDFTSFITSLNSGLTNTALTAGLDKLEIFDGLTVAAPLLASLQGDYSQRYSNASTPNGAGVGANTVNENIAAFLRPGLFCANNSSGALTIRFTSTLVATNPGWVAQVITFVKNTVGCNVTMNASPTTLCAGNSTTLTVNGDIVSSPLSNDFNGGSIGTGWSGTPASISLVNVLPCEPNGSFTSRNTDLSTFVWMANVAAPRSLISSNFNVSQGGLISFDYRQASDDNGSNACESPDGGSSSRQEAVYVQYSLDNGAIWNTFKVMYPFDSAVSASGALGCGPQVQAWSNVLLPIPTAAQSTSTRFRWIQPTSTTASQDSWGLDNVNIFSNNPKTITITNETAGGTIVGTSSLSNYSISVNPTVTTVFRATISDGISSCFDEVTVTVNSVTPTFTQVNPICSGQTLSALLTTSTNGITGTWSPALNNMTSTTYTFTPTSGLCATTETMTITVNPVLTPTINCGTSTTSSVQFVWAAVTDATSYTATYTVNAGATVNVGTTTSPYAVSGLSAGDVVAITITPIGDAGTCFASSTVFCTANGCVPPTMSLTSAAGTDAQIVCTSSAIIPIQYTLNSGTPPATDVTVTTGGFPAGVTGSFVAGVFTINGTPTASGTFNYTLSTTGGCAATSVTGIITVNPNVTPTFTQVNPVCSGATLTALPTTSTNGIAGTWLPTLNNTATTTYTFTPTAGLCATTQTMTITVNPNVTSTFTQVNPVCSGAALTALPTTSDNGIVGTWSPELNNTATTTYTFTPTTGLCATTQTMTITVNPNITPTFTQVNPICSGATLAALPTTSDNGIAGTWLPTLNNTATTTYTFTPTAGLCATTQTMTITVNPNITPTFTQVNPICSGATLTALPTTSDNGIAGTWLPTLNNTATTTYTFTPTAGLCATIQTMTITVNPNVTPTFTQVNPICSGATLTALPTTSDNGIAGTWLPALNNTATTTYTFTPTAGLCATTQTMIITVNPNITPTFTPVNPICSGGILSALPTTSTNGIVGIWSPALNNTATTTYTFTPTAGLCTTTQTMTITVNPNVTPTFNQVNPICSGAALTALPTISDNGIAGTWLPTLNNTATTTYTFTPTAGLCATTQTMIITVNPTITPTFTQVNPICSGESLSALPTTSDNGIAGTWLPTLNNTATTTYTFTPTAGLCATTQTMIITVNPNIMPTFTQVNPICSGSTLAALPTTSDNGIAGTWLPTLNNTATTTYTFTPTAGLCATTQTMTITVNPLPNPVLLDGSICMLVGSTIASQGFEFNAGSFGANYEFLWYELSDTTNPIATTSVPTYTVFEAGTYFVMASNLITGCINGSNDAIITETNPTLAFSTTVSDAFSDNTRIIVNVSGGTGVMLYQLDNGPFQESNIFTNVSAGPHTINVIDTLGCTSLTDTVLIINYPKYFTPNADSYNDNWNIVGLEAQLKANIFIFDRYGKLLKQLQPNEIGWDGTYNGHTLPSTDYWFSVEYEENGLQKTFRAHFSLKR